MTERLEPAQLDQILSLQLNVAWAGESAGDRLGWWKSDLVDPAGGGDLFERLTPKTAAWAGLILVRAAARQVEDALLNDVGRRDSIWTLFHLGFSVDEQLDDRLAAHRASLRPPAEVLPSLIAGTPWSKAGFEAELAKLGKPKVVTEPGYRRVDTKVGSPVEACMLLAAALLPLAPKYPLPAIEVTG